MPVTRLAELGRDPEIGSRKNHLGQGRSMRDFRHRHASMKSSAETKHDVIAFLTHLAEHRRPRRPASYPPGHDLFRRPGHLLQRSAGQGRQIFSLKDMDAAAWLPSRSRAYEHKETVHHRALPRDPRRANVTFGLKLAQAFMPSSTAVTGAVF